MRLILPIIIGCRYISSKRSSRHISFISLVSFAAMSLGVMVLIVVLSVMNGFDHEIKKRILNILPHASIVSDIGITDWKLIGDKLLKIDGIESYTPLVEGYGLLSSSSLSQGVLLQGISPLYEDNVSSISKHLIKGEIGDLKSGEFGIFIGSILADSLDVTFGDSVVLSLPKLNITPIGVFPRYKRFYIKGIYRVGAQVDSGLAFIHYEDAQKLFQLGTGVNGVKLKVKDPFGIESLVPYIKSSVGPSFNIKTWASEMTSLFSAIKMEKRIVALLLSVIIAIAGFNIIACLVLMVSNKRRDIAVLRTLGAKASMIATIFMIQGFVLGFLGIITGSILGCFLALNIGEIVSWVELKSGFHIFDPSIFFIVKIPSVLVLEDVLIICFFSLMLSILASIYPSYQASKISPAEALRYDR